jgi:hypothetical protein
MKQLKDKIESHKKFWQCDGPSLILIPPSRAELYDLDNYPKRFYDPQLMWENEHTRAEAVLDWPTDGIPTVRQNLGVITVPAMAGLSFSTPEDSMPWPGNPLSKKEIHVIPDCDLTKSEVFRLVADFYHIHNKKGNKQIAAYLPDTQGVFDIAHLLFGEEIFTLLLDNRENNWFYELMEISLQLYIRATEIFKAELNEGSGTMIHGHGTEQGVYFPHVGARISEDTAILLSPEMIEQSVIPFIKRSMEPFNGAFVHYCGYHPTFFDQLTALPEIVAIDLGNPEKYNIKSLMERCAETGTVLYSRVAEEQGEHWKDYINRIGDVVNKTKARVILRPRVFPESKEECKEMQSIWHSLTS